MSFSHDLLLLLFLLGFLSFEVLERGAALNFPLVLLSDRGWYEIPDQLLTVVTDMRNAAVPNQLLVRVRIPVDVVPSRENEVATTGVREL